MAEALKAEKADELGNPIKRLTVTARPPRAQAAQRPAKRPRVETPVARADTPVIEVSSDEEDLDYDATDSGTDPAESDDGFSSEWPGEVDSIEMLPSNAEVRSFFIFTFSFHSDALNRLPTCSRLRRSQKWGGAPLESECAGQWHSTCLQNPSMKATSSLSSPRPTVVMRTLRTATVTQNQK